MSLKYSLEFKPWLVVKGDNGKVVDSNASFIQAELNRALRKP